MLILGISCFYHDAAAAIIEDGKVVVAAQEERFSRKKHDESFPHKSIEFCLQELGLKLENLDAIVFYEKPFLKFERILETFTNVAPKGWKSFLYALPKWINEKIFFKSLLKKEIKKLGQIDFKKTPLLFTEHHLSHAAAAYYTSGYTDAAILVVDGVGEWATISISKGENNQIEIIKEIHFPHSIGMLYSAFTYFLGFKVNSGEYKLMGLSPYGNKGSEQVENFKNIINSNLISSRSIEGFQLNRNFFTYEYDLKMIDDTQWEKLFNIPKRKDDDEITQVHCDLALAIQEVTEELMLDLVAHAKEMTQSKNLCIAGGVALNCVSNGKILNSGIFDKYFVPSSPGDSGGSIGAALAIYHQYFQQELTSQNNKSAYLGSTSNEKDIFQLQRQYQAVANHLNTSDLIHKVSDELMNGKVIGWMQGRMEFGPRALGNRSILALPSIDNMQTKLNLKIKFREDFRPFAPILKAEKANKYFKLPQNAQYMEWIVPLQEEYRLPLPEGFENFSLKEKLKTPRSKFQAITHIDYTARPQTVIKEEHPNLYLLLDAVEQKSGDPILVNTSFNVRGEPIVCTTLDAYACFMQTDIDVLVIENYIFYKEDQPNTYLDIFKNRTFLKD